MANHDCQQHTCPFHAEHEAARKRQAIGHIVLVAIIIKFHHTERYSFTTAVEGYEKEEAEEHGAELIESVRYNPRKRSRGRHGKGERTQRQSARR